ncbi:MAG: CHAT domain-containing protein [Crocinitomicaceae bacterium]|nr:CHAT domain-containing protein [Crocinitomicaceae bacterium]MBK8927765.1 CHAT domain-containing protein [Crocinitomicaceae bacterium]
MTYFKYGILSIIFLLSSQIIFAQDGAKKHQQDSLWLVWSDTSQPDTLRLKAIDEMVWTYLLKTNPDSAVKCATLQYQLAQNIGNKNYAARSLLAMGRAKSQIGHYTEAINHYKNCLLLRREIGDTLSIAQTLNNIGNAYSDKGDTESAYANYLEAVQLITAIEDTFTLSILYNNLGIFFQDIGDLAMAINYYEQAIKLKRQLKDEKGEAVAMLNLGVAYFYIGDFNMAMNCYKAALNAFELIGNKNYVGTICNNMALIYKQQYKYNEAMEYFMRGLQLRIETNDIKGEANSYLNIGNLFFAQKKYTEALDNYAMSYKMKIETEGNQSIAMVLNAMSAMHFAMGNLSESKTCAKQAFFLSNESSSKIVMKESAKLLVSVFIKENQFDSAIVYLNVINELVIENIKINYFNISEKEKEVYVVKLSNDLSRLYEFVTYKFHTDHEMEEKALNNLLLVKGIGLRSSILLRSVILRSMDDELIELYEDWMYTRNKIAEKYTVGEDITGLEKEADELEKKLIKISGAFSDFNKIQSLDWKQVRKGLNEDEAAIEFVHFKSEIDTANPIIYAAFIVRPEIEHPDVVKLCTEDDLKNILGVIQGNNLSFVERVYGKKSEAKKDLYEKIWQPLEPYLQNVKTVYYSPSGLLHKVSFSAICKDQDVYLSDVYNFRQMGSTGNLAFENSTEFGDLENFLLMGGVEYQSEEESESEKVKEVWTYLPGSLAETNTINTFLKKKKFGVNYFSGLNASEEIFKEKISSSSIVHIATHGFFFPDPEQIRAENQRESGSENKNEDLKFRGTTNYANWSFVNNKNPLMRSGIVLANANDVWQRNPLAEGEDGILTAQEVSNLDLRNTKLVVLSACETGLGDIKGSEGVFGLQRAFKMAGVKYLIMSLWQVPDKETSEFMILFYKNLIKLKDIPTAFQKTQKLMREKYDPYYWGAFVLIE